MMDNKVQAVSELMKNRSDWQIVVRITRLWLAVRRGISAENANLEAIGLDDKGDHIHIEIENEDVSKYKHLLKEGSIYKISKFAVKSDIRYKPVLRNIKLVFTSTTEVIPIREADVQIANHKFEFVDYQIVHDGRNRDEQLFDLIGVYVGGGEPTTRNTGQVQRTNVTIQDLSGKHCAVTLWGDVSENFSSMKMLAQEGTKILIFTSLLVRRYIPPACASNTAATKIYLNLDYPDVKQYLRRYEKEKIEPVLLPTPTLIGRSRVDNMVVSHKTIDQLLNLPRDYLEVQNRGRSRRFNGKSSLCALWQGRR